MTRDLGKNPELTDKQHEYLELLLEHHDLPTEVQEAVRFLSSAESQMGQEQFEELVKTLAKTPHSEDAEFVVRGIVKG